MRLFDHDARDQAPASQRGGEVKLLVGRLSTKTPDREPRWGVLPCGDSAAHSHP